MKLKSGQPAGLGRVIGPALVLLLVVLVLTKAGFYYLWYLPQEQTQARALAEAYAGRAAVLLNLTYQQRKAQLDAINRPTELLPTLRSGDPGALAALEQRLAADVPDELGLRLVPAVGADTAMANLSFTAQDMVRRVLEGRPVRADLSHQAKKLVIVQAAAVRESAAAPIEGVLVYSADISPLEGNLRELDPEAGFLELKQQLTPQKQVTILTAGDVQWQSAQPLRVVTAHPDWTLEFSQGEVLAAGGARTILLAILALEVVALMVIVAWLLISLHRRVAHDGQLLGQHAEGLFHYNNQTPPAFDLAVFDGLAGHLRRLAADAQLAVATARVRGMKQAVSDAIPDVVVSHADQALLTGASASSVRAGVAGSPATGIKKGQAGERRVEAVTMEQQEAAVNGHIFRAYDIRGVVGRDLDRDSTRLIGLAIGSEAAARGEQTVVVGRDGRLSSPDLAKALIEGLQLSGRDVVDVGMVPTPVLYFAATTQGTGSGVMITGSHNPPDYNGFKIMLAGQTLSGEAIKGLHERIEKSSFTAGTGTVRELNVVQDYLDRVLGDVVLAHPLKVVIDAGNGVAGAIAPRLFEQLGCEVVPLFCEVDGNFPNHHPDPSKPENLEALMALVASQGADLGLAFDGDGDRVGVVTPAGKSIFPDRLLMLFAKHVLVTNPGADIIFDVKCTRDLISLITSHGGRPVMCRTGHSFIKAKLKETGAALAGEMSGHIFFNDRWYGFDDGLYSGARLLEILAMEGRDADTMFAEFPENPCTPEINITVPEERKFALVQQLQAVAKFPGATVSTLDGLRVDFSDGWGLIRASNTTPVLVARFEGRTPEALARISQQFRELLRTVDPTLTLPL